MTIASEITKLNNNLTDCYTAVDNKGGTLPQAQNFDNLPTAISSIPSGGSAVITSLNVTPTTSAQTITAPSGTDGYSPINVSAVTASIDSNISAGNIKSGVSILGVSGSVTELKGETMTVSLTNKNGQTFTPSSGKNGITSITVIPDNQARTVTPSTSSQSLTVNSGHSGNGTITVNAVTSSIDSNITAGNIKSGVSILGVTGTYSGTTPSGTINITSNGTYNVTNYASANVSVSGGGGGGGSGTRDVPLARFKDDTNTEIGTWYMNFADANGNEYKVICLDAQYRNSSTNWCSDRNAVTNMPLCSNNITSWWYNAHETATENTQLILDYCTAGGYTSTSCIHCRSKSFTINGTTYYGQLPNMRELFDMWRYRADIESMDTSASTSSSTNFSTHRTLWSSSQYTSKYGLYFLNSGIVAQETKTFNYFACPVLEIPV